MTVLPFPNTHDEAAVAVWAGKVVTAFVPVGFDLIKSDPVIMTGGFGAEEAPTEEEIEAAYYAVKARGGFGGVFEKLGDGTILAILKNIPWATLIQTAVTIIGFLPKTPAPAAVT